jgi:hypothetical protein
MFANKVPANVLSLTHYQTLQAAVTRILKTEVARQTYAQILDGAPNVHNKHTHAGPHNRHEETGEEAYQAYDAFRPKFSLDLLSFPALVSFTTAFFGGV